MFLMGMFAVMEEPENYGRLSDEKLLLKIAKGDQEAFRQLYQNTDKTMYSFILSDIGLSDLSEMETGEFCPQIENAADKVVLHAALHILKEEERQIVLLHTAAGLKHREIAADLGMPLATVLSKYNRAMKKLKNHLREEG